MKTETETTHTPKPWKVADEAPHCILGPADTGLGIVATAAREGTHGKEGRANARLIAAAPDMFEALRACLAEIEQFHHTAYPKCEGQCPAHEAMELARKALEKVAP